MIAMMLAAAAVPMTAIEAERAFAADAQALGQWTAFRKWAAEDALMFAPEPVNAHEFLKGREDPPVSVFWWPGRSFVSCDGSHAINTGPWVREWGKSVGYFTTVWKRQGDGGWKWIYDAGDSLEMPRAEGGYIKPRTPDCSRPAPQFEYRKSAHQVEGGHGSSPDNTLAWTWTTRPNDARRFRAYLWNGSEHELVIEDEVAAPPR